MCDDGLVGRLEEASAVSYKGGNQDEKEGVSTKQWSGPEIHEQVMLIFLVQKLKVPASKEVLASLFGI